MENLKIFTLLSTNGIVLEKEQIESLKRLHDELLYWNKKVNLISRKDTENIWERHIIHSLVILKYFDLKEKARCLDVGTGGGFPGVPLKIASPELRITLVDSINKKVKIADMFGQHTGLKNIHGICSRMEELPAKKEFYRTFDYIFARAVAPISQLLYWTQYLIKPGGEYIFLKGGDLNEEIQTAKKEFKNYIYDEIPITFIGIDWFEQESKKIIHIRVPK